MFTREQGRVHFLAKGARSGGKRAPTPLIPVALLEVIWKPSTKSELQLLREVSLLDGFGAIHQDLDRLAWAQAALETLARTLNGQEPHEALFTMTVGYLKALAAPDANMEKLFYRFQLRVLKELGYAMDLSLPEGRASHLMFLAGHGKVVGVHPQDVSTIKRRGQVLIRPGHWMMLQALGGDQGDAFKRLKLTQDAKREIETVMQAAYQHAFDHWKPLESLKLIKGRSNGNV